MSADIGCYIIGTAINYFLWLLFGEESSVKKSLEDAFLCQVIYTLILLGAGLLEGV